MSYMQRAIEEVTNKHLTRNVFNEDLSDAYRLRYYLEVNKGLATANLTWARRFELQEQLRTYIQDIFDREIVKK